MSERPVRPVRTDGSPSATAELSDALADALAGSGPAVLPLDADDPAPDEARTAPVDPSIAVVVATSGSTGAPKAVLLPAAALHSSIAATHDRLGGPGRWLLPLPAHHVAGVQVLLRSLVAGSPAVMPDLRGGFRPGAFAAAAAHSGARYTSLVPTQLSRLLDAGGPPLEVLRGFAAILVGGAATAPALLERARAAELPVVTTYGCSETCGGCVYDGLPLDGVRVAIEPSGRIRLGGAVLAAGYRGSEPVRTGGAADAEPGRGGDTGGFVDGGWFRTADLGRWVDGRLDVLGRADDVVVSGGENVAPARVERALLALPDVDEACVVGVPDPEWGERVVAAVVGSRLDPERAPQALRAAVGAELGRATPREIHVVAGLPSLGIGKPDRAAVRDLVGNSRPS